jgi:iron complex transport system permease protein
MVVSAEENKNHINNRSKRRTLFVALCAAALLVVFSVLSLCLGAVHVSLSDIFAVMGGDKTSSAARILRFVRLPRLLAAVASGSALACSGAIIQSVLHNPLGSPNIIGVNAGAGLAVILCAVIAPHFSQILPIASFIGAFAALLLVYALGRKAGDSRTTILLAGVALNTFFAAVTDAITVIVPDTIYGRTSFRIGSFASVQMNVLVPASIVIFAAILIACFLRNELDVLALGDETSSGLGLPVSAIRFTALLLAAILAGAGVSFAGLLGFVGLIVPHCARAFVGNEMRHLLPVSALFGAVLVVLCDLLSRIVCAPYEIPVGVLLSLIGGPFFIWLLLSGRRRRADRD